MKAYIKKPHKKQKQNKHSADLVKCQQLKCPDVIELLQTSCIHLFIVTKQLVHLI